MKRLLVCDGSGSVSGLGSGSLSGSGSGFGSGSGSSSGSGRFEHVAAPASGNERAMKFFGSEARYSTENPDRAYGGAQGREPGHGVGRRKYAAESSSSAVLRDAAFELGASGPGVRCMSDG
jgi:hypothetical protein